MALSQDIREMSFQNVLDTILKPAGVKVGGYPEDIFTDISDEEFQKTSCNIWYNSRGISFWLCSNIYCYNNWVSYRSNSSTELYTS